MFIMIVIVISIGQLTGQLALAVRQSAAAAARLATGRSPSGGQPAVVQVAGRARHGRQKRFHEGLHYKMKVWDPSRGPRGPSRRRPGFLKGKARGPGTGPNRASSHKRKYIIGA